MPEFHIEFISAGFDFGRRRVLRLCLLGFAGCGATVFGPALADQVSDVPDAWLMRLVSGNGSAARLGADYLKQYPDEAAVKILCKLVRRPSSKDNFSPESFADLESAIASIIQNEYRADRIVQVDEWLLSRSEARLYALSSLRMTG